MATKKMTRADVCEKLISNEIDTIKTMIESGDFTYIDSIVGDGVVGFNNLSNNDLTEEWANTFDEDILIIGNI